MANFLHRWHSTLSRIFDRSLFDDTLKQTRRPLEVVSPSPGHHTHQALQQRAARILFRWLHFDQPNAQGLPLQFQEALPIPDDDDVHVTPTNPATLPVRSEDSGSDDDHAASVPADRLHDNPPPPPPAPAAPDAPPPAPRLGHTIRGWAQIDDTELISLKQDARARHSWKAIGQRLHREPDSCKARWYWLKSSRPELTAPAAETED